MDTNIVVQALGGLPEHGEIMLPQALLERVRVEQWAGDTMGLPLIEHIAKQVIDRIEVFHQQRTY